MYNVMIVDDLEMYRSQVRNQPVWGENSGFSIIAEAKDGKDALGKLKEKPVDLLISDIRMPQMDGIELLRIVTREKLATAVVFLSEYQEFHLAQEAIQHGVFDYLIKPVRTEDLTKLLVKVKTVLDEEASKEALLKRMEEAIKHQEEILYPANDVARLARAICDKETNAVKKAELLALSVLQAHQDEVVKGRIMLARACSDILEQVKKQHPWFVSFLAASGCEELGPMANVSEDLVLERFGASIHTMQETYERFIFKQADHPVVDEICEMVLTLVEERLNPGLLADKLFMSRNYMGDLFKSETEMTLGNYITMVKMERAKILLVNERNQVQDVAIALGYTQVEYFSKTFKKHTSMSPSKYQQAIKQTKHL